DPATRHAKPRLPAVLRHAASARASASGRDVATAHPNPVVPWRRSPATAMHAPRNVLSTLQRRTDSPPTSLSLHAFSASARAARDDFAPVDTPSATPCLATSTMPTAMAPSALAGTAATVRQRA